MGEPDFTKELFDQLSQIIYDLNQGLKKKSFMDEMPDDINDRLDIVEDMIHAYQQGVDDLLQASGTTARAMRDELQKEIYHLPKQEIRRLKNIALMSKEIGAIRDGMKYHLEHQGDKEKPSQKKRSKRHHEGDIGFGQGWTKL